MLISNDDSYYVREPGAAGAVIIVSERIDGILPLIGKVDFGHMC